jgi:hypothetical protein
LTQNPNSQNLDMAWWEHIWTASGIPDRTPRK